MAALCEAAARDCIMQLGSIAVSVMDVRMAIRRRKATLQALCESTARDCIMQLGSMAAVVAGRQWWQRRTAELSGAVV